MIWLLLVWNAIISTANAYFAGREWLETQYLGWWSKLCLWSACTMSLCGYLGIYAVCLFEIATRTGAITPTIAEQGYGLIYLAIAFPVVASGLILMVDSQRRAFQARHTIDIVASIYDTVAQVHNTLNVGANFLNVAADTFGGIWESASGDDDEDSAIGLIVLAIIFGVSVGLAYYTFKSVFNWGYRDSAVHLVDNYESTYKNWDLDDSALRRSS